MSQDPDSITCLSDVVIVNESHSYNVPGDLSIFRSVGDASTYLEYWWIEQGLGFALSGCGLPIEMRTAGQQVTLEICRNAAADVETLRTWLISAAAAVRAAKAYKARGGMREAVDALSFANNTWDLIREIGFEQA